MAHIKDKGRRMILGAQLKDVDAAALLEQAGLDFVLFGDMDTGDDGQIGYDPLTLAAFAMTTTRRMGLVAVTPLHWAPFNVARALASMDHLSGGRCGWCPSPSGPPPDASPLRRLEHMEVVLKLLDSWEDDALVFDKAQGVFADRTKVHRIRHGGVNFTVDGPLNAPRPLQGHPVMVQRAELDGPDVDILIMDPGAPGRPLAAPQKPTLYTAPLDAGRESASLVQQMAQSFQSGACAGFFLTRLDPEGLTLLIDQIMPTLRRMGLVEGDPPGADFRSRLGLPRPPNRVALQNAAMGRPL